MVKIDNMIILQMNDFNTNGRRVAMKDLEIQDFTVSLDEVRNANFVMFSDSVNGFTKVLKERYPEVKPDYVDFNINEYVKIKLTDVGRAELEKQHDEFNKQCSCNMEYNPLIEDSDGFVEEQLWVIMRELGSLITHGGKQPFETGIKFKVG